MKGQRSDGEGREAAARRCDRAATRGAGSVASLAGTGEAVKAIEESGAKALEKAEGRGREPMESEHATG